MTREEKLLQLLDEAADILGNVRSGFGMYLNQRISALLQEVKEQKAESEKQKAEWDKFFKESGSPRKSESPEVVIPYSGETKLWYPGWPCCPPADVVRVETINPEY